MNADILLLIIIIVVHRYVAHTSIIRPRRFTKLFLKPQFHAETEVNMSKTH